MKCAIKQVNLSLRAFKKLKPARWPVLINDGNKSTAELTE